MLIDYLFLFFYVILFHVLYLLLIMIDELLKYNKAFVETKSYEKFLTTSILTRRLPL